MTIKVEKQLSNDRDKVLIIVISPFLSLSLSLTRSSLKQKEMYQHFFECCLVCSNSAIVLDAIIQPPSLQQ